jgi:hypothetical protein
MSMGHGHVYEKRYIMHEIDRMSIVALESYTTGIATFESYVRIRMSQQGKAS